MRRAVREARWRSDNACRSLVGKLPFCIVVAAVLLAGIAGCRTTSHTERGATAGGLAGGLAGAALARSSGDPASGAAWGGALGAVVGGLIGHEKDKQEALARHQQTHGKPVSVQDVVTLVQSGVQEPVIVDHIRTYGMARPLQTEDLVYLHQNGVGDGVIQAMQEVTRYQNARAAAAAAPEKAYHGPPWWSPFWWFLLD